jgi:hypothetical protein
MASELPDNMQWTLARRLNHNAKAKYNKQRIPIFPKINKQGSRQKALDHWIAIVMQ